MRLLVTFGSKDGGTEGLAEAIAARLRTAEHDVIVTPAHAVQDVDAYDAVVVGGALCAHRWQRRAVRFVERFVDELGMIPVWFFSSGPLDASASASTIAPIGQVARLMGRVRARGHATIGGRLDATARGFIASKMVANGHGGDFRDWKQVDTWADAIATELGALEIEPINRVALHGMHSVRRFITGLAALSAFTAVIGGAELMAWPRGAAWLPISRDALKLTPFRDLFWPGLILFVCVGLLNAWAALALSARLAHAELVAAVSGGALCVFILAEMVLLRAASVFDVCYLALGATTSALSLRLMKNRASQHASEPRPLSALNQTTE